MLNSEGGFPARTLPSSSRHRGIGLSEDTALYREDAHPARRLRNV